MEKCGECGESVKFVWNIDGTSYCKKCHPTMRKLIKLIDEKAVNRSRLPKDLGKYFAADYVQPALFPLYRRVCARCKETARYYTWYDNNYPSKMYRYCTKCNTISSKSD